jgi:hypothetical protein
MVTFNENIRVDNNQGAGCEVVVHLVQVSEIHEVANLSKRQPSHENL